MRAPFVHALGLEPRKTLARAQDLSRYRSTRREFRRQMAVESSDWAMGRDFPCLGDSDLDSGTASGQYFHQDLYVAQQIFAARPKRHLDVGSRIDGFVAHVASFMIVDVLDIRPLGTSASNIRFLQRDLTLSDATLDGTIESLSCLHALEHFGLGRYGDTVDVNGYLKGWSVLCRLLAPGGRFYFSVPVSQRERIEFNAHRLFGFPRLLEMIEPTFEILALAGVDDQGDLLPDLDPKSAAAQRTFDIDYGCLIFTLMKR